MITLNALGLKYEDFDVGGKYAHIYDEWVLKNEYPNNDDTWQFFIDQVFNVTTTGPEGLSEPTQIRLEIEAMIVKEIRNLSKRPRYDIRCPHCQAELQACRSMGMEAFGLNDGYGNCPHCKNHFMLTYNFEEDKMSTSIDEVSKKINARRHQNHS